jgi:GNAT superfamily N-acetyltransferase
MVVRACGLAGFQSAVIAESVDFAAQLALVAAGAGVALIPDLAIDTVPDGIALLPLTPGTFWWEGLDAEPEPGFASEDGHRTFALSEIMVRQEMTGRGIAHALHDELLGARHEKRATLLAEPENTPAYRAYTSWGWHTVPRLARCAAFRRSHPPAAAERSAGVPFRMS